MIEAGGADDFLTRALRRAIDQDTARLEYGHTVLASVASSAPFVGLFGTVWGIYHALLAIGMSGQGTLDKVAGPVGEALIMTALGLAVAIPAVLAYNAFTRANRNCCWPSWTPSPTTCSPSSPPAIATNRRYGRLERRACRTPR
jgi:biopolymer transport protein ExbB